MKPDDKININYKLTTNRDNEAESPLSEDWLDPVKMVCTHRRYTLGSAQGKSAREVIDLIAEDLGVDLDGDYDNALSLISEKAFIQPVSLYDHSGISMSIGEAQGWDCGQVGFVYVDKEKFEKECTLVEGETWETQAEKVFEDTVSIYSSYLQGDVYSISLQKMATIGGEDESSEIMLSEDYMGGFYGDETKTNGIPESIKVYFIGKDFDNFDLPDYVDDDEETEMETTHLFSELSSYDQEKIEKASQNIGLKMVVDENQNSHVKIGGISIDNILFKDKKTSWEVKSRADFVEQLSNIVEQDTLGGHYGEWTTELKADIEYLNGFTDEFMFYSREANDCILRSNSREVFDKICESIIALNNVEIALSSNLKHRLENAKNKTETSSPSLPR